MNLYLFIAIGGAFGAMSRYWLISSLGSLNSNGFPIGVFLTNVLGSFFIGVALVLISEKMQFEEQLRSLIIIGFLGAFTTFSTFSLDALLLLQQGHYNTALLYIVGSVLLCLISVFAGIHVVRLLV